MTEKKTVVVTEAVTGRERHYDADGWAVNGHVGLDITHSSREDNPVIAVYAHDAWLSVRESDATVPDPASRAVRVVGIRACREGRMGGAAAPVRPRGRGHAGQRGR